MTETKGEFGLEIACGLPNGLRFKIKASDEGYIPNLEVLLDTLFDTAKTQFLTLFGVK